MYCEQDAARPPEHPGAPAMASFSERSRMWSGGWRRWVFPGLWLIYLVQTVDAVRRNAEGAVEVLGYAIVGAFAVCYLLAVSSGWEMRLPRFFWLYGTCFVLTAAEAFIAGHDAFVFFVYIAVLTVAGLRSVAVYIVGAMALLTLFAPRIFPGWHGELAYADALAVVLVGLAMYGFFAVIQSNLELAAARAEVARLAAENERTRIARDLHDLLGHSLTAITVKAGLARRLTERGEHGRAAAEIGEVESLARRTLGDVRAAVAGHREVTLAGELATAREVLRAAGITAELPASVDIVDPARSELFGWVVREAITNVVRHARATRCTVGLGPSWVQIDDDGRGGVTADGNGMTGLRERVAAVGGTVRVGGRPNGWRVRVDAPAVTADEPDHGLTVAP